MATGKGVTQGETLQHNHMLALVREHPQTQGPHKVTQIRSPIQTQLREGKQEASRDSDAPTHLKSPGPGQPTTKGETPSDHDDLARPPMSRGQKPTQIPRGIPTGNVLLPGFRFLKSISRQITGPLSRLPISSFPSTKVTGFSIIMDDR